MKPTLPEPEVLDRHLPTNTPITRGYTWKTVQRLIDAAYAAGLEDAANEAEHWQKISTTPGHACGQYIAAAILSLKDGS